MKAIKFHICTIHLLLSISLNATAEPPTPLPTITRASDLISTVATKFPIGTLVTFPIQAKYQTKNPTFNKIQVRIFPLLDDEERPSRVSSIGDCDIYISSTRVLTLDDNKSIKFARLDEGWINVSYSGSTLKDGKWFLVFEEVGASSDQFRIRNKDTAIYFETGFILTVFDNGTIPLEKVRDAYDARRKAGVKLRKEIDTKDSKIPCYTYKKVNIASDDMDLLASSTIECKVTPES